MAASKGRIDGALLILRLAVGGWAMLQGVQSLPRSGWKPSFPAAWELGLSLVKVVAGALTLVGVWTLPAALCLTALAFQPVLHALLRGSPLMKQAGGLFHTLTALACALGGGGRWSLGHD